MDNMNKCHEFAVNAAESAPGDKINLHKSFSVSLILINFDTHWTQTELSWQLEVINGTNKCLELPVLTYCMLSNQAKLA